VVFTNIRPSTSFITVTRENHAQTKYVDEQKKGPSFLIRRDEVPTLKSMGEDIHYNTERKGFRDINNQQNTCKDKIEAYQGQLVSKDGFMTMSSMSQLKVSLPSEKRKEINQMKLAVKEFKDTKTQLKFIKKRNRIIQNGYREGIVGVEMPGDRGSQFYSAAVIREEVAKAKKLEGRNRCKLIWKLIFVDL
jgi:hypothetical protein